MLCHVTFHDDSFKKVGLKVNNEIEFITKEQNDPIDQDLLADVAHKIKNGLGGIGGFAALLERDIEKDDPRKRLVQRIQNGVYRVNDVVVRLMLLAQEIEPCFEESHIQLLLKEIWNSIVEENREICQNAQLDFPEEKLIFSIDANLFQKMIHYTILLIDQLGGDVQRMTIYPGPGGSHLMNIHVLFNHAIFTQSHSENGLNIPNGDISVEGRLDLALVQKIVKLHGGTLKFSPSEGDGTMLRIQLETGK